MNANIVHIGSPCVFTHVGIEMSNAIRMAKKQTRGTIAVLVGRFFGNNRREKGEDNSPHSTLNREQELSKIQSFAPSSTFDRLRHIIPVGKQGKCMGNQIRNAESVCLIDLLTGKYE